MPEFSQCCDDDHKNRFTISDWEEIQSIRLRLQEHEAETGDSFQGYSDMTILRFIRGRAHDLDKAFRAIVRNLKWRLENNVDNIKPESFESESLQNKLTLCGVDVEGRPVLRVNARNHNKYDRDLDKAEWYIIYRVEEAMKITKAYDEKLTILFDLDEFSLQCMDYDALKLIVEIFQFNYPETLSVALVSNSPFLFNACWAIIRLWLDPVTAAKVKFIYASDIPSFVKE